MDGFEENREALEALGAAVVAASVDAKDKTAELADRLSFRVAFGVTKAQADDIGAWWEERRQIVQPSNFVVDETGKVLSATYSTGPVGRLEAADAVRFIQFQEKQRQKEA